MRFVSTAGRAPSVSLEQAVFAGPAPDGGLYVPETLPELTPPVGGGLGDTAFLVARCLFAGELSDRELEPIVRESLDFDIPLVALDEGISSLELFHGPTHAFKDVGARFMARLMLHFLDGRATVLVATSGDTGSAVAHAFFKLDGIRVVVLFPRGKVSELQRRLFTTLGENVQSLSVDGTFDDCQSLVKRAFADRELDHDGRLVSANSINVGRLLPQTFYYFHMFAQLREAERENVAVCTPSGNFGNLTAGLMAKRMGLPVSQFIAATNANDVVPRYLTTGEFRPRPSLETLSNAMDVGNPSNFARMLWLYGGDVDAMRRDVVGFAYSDEQTLRTIESVHERLGYVVDPHSAIGYLGARESDAAARVFLATAHPAKFRETVEPAIHEKVPLPRALHESANRPEYVTEMPVDYEALKDYLTSS
jgi:threonine synthase